MNTLSEHYEGKLGEEYFARQNEAADDGGVLKAHPFHPYIETRHSVLDFGCGGGWMLKHLEANRRVGIEPNAVAHPVCKQNGIEVYENITQLTGQTFDRIVSNHCLEHVSHPTEVLRSLSHLLAPNGMLLLMLPIDDWRVQKDFSGGDKDHHLHTWSPRLIANTLSDAGLHTNAAKVLTRAWPWKWRTFYKLLPQPLFSLVCFGWSILMRRRELFVIASPFDTNRHHS